MAFTKIVSPGIDTTGSYTVQELNTVGVVTAGTVQVGSATTIHTTGIDLGSGNITSHNINSTGIITATSFVGPVTGNITGDVTATSGTFSGNVSIGGTLTYEDVTNIDSVGVITARSGINVTGGQLNVAGNMQFTAADPELEFNNGGPRFRVPAANTLTVHTGGGLGAITNERLRITSDGNIGINTTNPTSYANSQATLVIEDDTNPAICISDTGQARDWWLVGQGDGLSLKYADGGGSGSVSNVTSAAFFKNNGNFGIGTNDPDSILHAQNNSVSNTKITVESTGTNSYPAFRVKNDARSYDLGIDGATDAFRIYDATATAERLRILSTGEIFVGGSSTYNVIANYVNTAKLHLSGAGGGSANIELYGSGHATDPKIMTVNTNNIERLRITSGGSVGIGQSNPNKAKLHVVGPGTGSDEIIAKFKGGSGADCTSKIGIVAGYSDTANDTEGHVYIGALRQGNGNQSSMIFQTDGQNTRMRISADGSTYRGGTVITESDMYWGHDTYQRPHIFSGRSGGNPSDGAIVLASPETDPSATRIGSIVYGCKTSSGSGVANSGLKAAIEGFTNTNLSDAWKTGGSLRFLIRPDNGNLTVAQNIDSNGTITKTLQPGFYARRTTAGDGRAAGTITEWHISGTGSYNAGNHFKTSGADAGKFVAPVSGKYYFAAQPGYKQTSNNFQFYFRINGSAVSEPVRVIDGGDDLTSHCSFTGTCIIYMTAGQKFDVYVGNTHHVNTTYCFFCGYLVG
jgi:hypothetical protein